MATLVERPGERPQKPGCTTAAGILAAIAALGPFVRFGVVLWGLVLSGLVLWGLGLVG